MLANFGITTKQKGHAPQSGRLRGRARDSSPPQATAGAIRMAPSKARSTSTAEPLGGPYLNFFLKLILKYFKDVKWPPKHENGTLLALKRLATGDFCSKRPISTVFLLIESRSGEYPALGAPRRS